ncbi:hypothetical protein B0H34DRAFT_798491 [Crassisporium funariophilum]|nr:hypothetical protein B0H34DRAFT_798483 [Crassisporium funariophilum]KAF8157190.1 hypothetical protein B0H34DRAFT_798491 [Crassisporium funariophilum]
MQFLKALTTLALLFAAGVSAAPVSDNTDILARDSNSASCKAFAELCLKGVVMCCSGLYCPSQGPFPGTCQPAPGHDHTGKAIIH